MVDRGPLVTGAETLGYGIEQDLSGPWSSPGSAPAVIPEAYRHDLPPHLREVTVRWRPLRTPSAGAFAVVVELVDITFSTGRQLDGAGLLLRWTRQPLLDDREAREAAENHARLLTNVEPDVLPVVSDGVIVPLLYLEAQADGRRWALSVMERATGGSLADMIGWGAEGDAGTAPWTGGIGFRAAARVLVPVANALTGMHGWYRQGHRDLHVKNIVLRRGISSPTPSDEELADLAAIIDFDLVREIDRRSLLTGAPMAMDDFRPPELWRWEEEPLRPDRIDVWQLAVVWCVLACGASPFAGRELGDREASARRGVPDSPAFLARQHELDLDELDTLAGFLDPDPALREDMPALRALILRVAGLTTLPSSSPALQRARKQRQARLDEALDPEPKHPAWWQRISPAAPWAAFPAVLAGLLAWRFASSWSAEFANRTALERWTVLAGAVVLLVAVSGALWAGILRRHREDPGRPTGGLAVLAALVPAVPAVGAWLLLTRVTDGGGWIVLLVLTGVWLASATLVAVALQRRWWGVTAALVLIAVVSLSALQGSWWQPWRLVGGSMWLGVAVLALLVVMTPSRGPLVHAFSLALLVLVLADAGASTRWATAWSPVDGRPAPAPQWIPDLEPGAADLQPTSFQPEAAALGVNLGDDPATGTDEREFVHLRRLGDDGAEWLATATDVQVGESYEVRIRARSGAGPDGSSEAPVSGLTLRVDLAAAGAEGAAVIRPRLWWSGGPDATGAISDPVSLSGPEGFSVRVVPGSARVDDGRGEDVVLDDDVVNGPGELIGVDESPGELPAGSELEITLLVEVEAPAATTSLVVTPLPDIDWGRAALLAQPGADARIALYVRNDGVVQNESVVVAVQLPDALVHSPSSTTFASADGEGRRLGEAVAQEGVDVGPIPPGSGGWLQFRLSTAYATDCPPVAVPVTVAVTFADGVRHATVDVLAPPAECG